MSESKTQRQNKILELILKEEIGTQEELTDQLRRAGFSATQETSVMLLTARVVRI